MAAHPADASLAPGSEPQTVAVELAIEGMTCASCANRIERKLNKLDGVSASVNYATEQARVTTPAGFDPHRLITTVEDAGYRAQLPTTAGTGDDGDDSPGVDRRDRELEMLRQRLLITSALAVSVILISMIPALQFTYWQWLCLTLAAPVIVWGGWPFHRAAWINLRHGAATLVRVYTKDSAVGRVLEIANIPGEDNDRLIIESVDDHASDIVQKIRMLVA